MSTTWKHDKMQLKEECVMECVCVQWILQNERWDDDIEVESDTWREPGGIASYDYTQLAIVS